MNFINYTWRLIATAIAFSIFGIGGLLAGVIVFPVIKLVPVNHIDKMRLAQRYVQANFYFFIGFMHRSGIMTYKIRGLEKLNRRGQLIIANHPTLIDIVFLISRISSARCVAKASLLRNPFMRGAILNAGYISNKDLKVLTGDCVACLRNGSTLIIFPEGTRSVPGKPYKFQPSAAAIALRSNAILTPVILNCTPNTLTKTNKWYQIPHRRFHLEMQVGDDIVLDSFLNKQPESTAVRHLNRYLQDYFSQKREADEQQPGK